MGNSVAEVARGQGWEVTVVLGPADTKGGNGITAAALGNADVAVEFTEPAAAAANISACLRAKVPVVVGTTGWYDALPEDTRVEEERGTGLLWAAIFSLGVNVFIEVARYDE